MNKIFSMSAILAMSTLAACTVPKIEDPKVNAGTLLLESTGGGTSADQEGGK